jgi:hypothetical protein
MSSADSRAITAALQPPQQFGHYGAMPPDAAPFASGSLPPPVQPNWLPSTISLPTRDELAAIFDVTTNGQAMLSATGGLALAVLGVRTLFGGRRKRPTSREASRETFRED